MLCPDHVMVGSRSRSLLKLRRCTAIVIVTYPLSSHSSRTFLRLELFLASWLYLSVPSLFTEAFVALLSETMEKNTRIAV